jgi:hypothetical protein
MKEIKTEIILKNGSVEDAWKILTNFEEYPAWNTFITKITGQKAIGQSLLVDITPPNGKKSTFNPILIKFSENKEIRWVGKIGFKWLFCGEHYFKLEVVDKNTTRFIHGEIFTGILTPLFMLLAHKQIVAGFNLMNEQLNRELEKASV